jgi:hypothetical protein
MSKETQAVLRLARGNGNVALYYDALPEETKRKVCRELAAWGRTSWDQLSPEARAITERIEQGG